MIYRPRPFDKLLARLLRLQHGRVYVFGLLNLTVVLATSALLKLSLPTTGKLVVMLIVGLLVLYLWNRACDLPRKMFWTSEDDGRGRRYYPLILTRKPNGRNDLWKYSYLSLDEHEAAALDREQAEKALWPSLKRLING